MTKDEIIKEYILTGKKCITIGAIATIRDGGTKVLKSYNNDIYIDKDSKRFHTSYPTSENNLITCPIENAYITISIEKYVENLKDEIKRVKLLLNDIKRRA
jgi:hypothetical protein